ncbi:hypothetical protein [Actinoallomurus soli]|uniref:hypothetical protein n=1 Tax=Actinoallomurus soli TaxID=2952535 RepID=UPI0020931E7D|nr:hypothetical protein [Actinoallomurus soli]MCO5971590.1 hypothetical protein [Actinoallomurus soli]
MAAPASAASADTKAVIGKSLQSGVSAEASIKYHYWQIGGSKHKGYTRWTGAYDIAGVYTYGKYGTSGGKVVLYVYGKDTKADGRSAGIEIKGLPGYKYPQVFTPKKGKKTFSVGGSTGAKTVYIREVLGNRNKDGVSFDVKKAGKWKKISA